MFMVLSLSVSFRLIDSDTLPAARNNLSSGVLSRLLQFGQPRLDGLVAVQQLGNL
jgi:hypothetical protein